MILISYKKSESLHRNKTITLLILYFIKRHSLNSKNSNVDCLRFFNITSSNFIFSNKFNMFLFTKSCIGRTLLISYVITYPCYQFNIN